MQNNKVYYLISVFSWFVIISKVAVFLVPHERRGYGKCVM